MGVEQQLSRWTTAGVVSATTAAAILRFEAEQQTPRQARTLVRLVVAGGGLLIAAGVLLFVAAHWDALSPAWRFSLVLSMIAAFHGLGITFHAAFPIGSAALHAIGTITLGAGIYLTGQIFHLQEHWPAAIMLWAIGAALGWVVRHDWPHVAMTAILVPGWIWSEWMEVTKHLAGGNYYFLSHWPLLIAVTYLTAATKRRQDRVTYVLQCIGGLALIPSTCYVIFGKPWAATWSDWPTGYIVLGFMELIGLPLLAAIWWRRRAAWVNLFALSWVFLLGRKAPVMLFEHRTDLARWSWIALEPYVLCVIGAIGLIAWGVKESQRIRINLGIAGFAFTIGCFYFSEVMDKLGRSMGLIGLGVLFVGGGWYLERVRRRCIARTI